MNEFSVLLNNIFEKIKAFFEVIDLAKLIAGGAAILLIYFWQFLNGYTFKVAYFQNHMFLINVFIAYVLGLIAFAIGRPFRRFLVSKLCKEGKSNNSSKKYDNFSKKIKLHNLNEDINIKRYLSLDNDLKYDALLEFLWSDLRQNEQYGYSKSFLMKYWSISVLYDSIFGVTFFLDLIAFDLINGKFGISAIGIDQQLIFNIFYLVFSLLLKYSIVTTAVKYDKYQNNELLASYAVLRNRELNKGSK